MDPVKVKAAILAMGFLLLYTISHAQKSAATVWRKEVARQIEFKNAGTPETSLLQMVINELKTGKITAYSNYDHSFTTKLTLAALNGEISPEPDTSGDYGVPIAGAEMTRTIPQSLDYSKVTQWRIYEDWLFNPATGLTYIQAQGIAPIKTVIVDGDFRGYQALFWVRYAAMEGIIAHYEKAYPNKSLLQKMWNDYFSSDVNSTSQAMTSGRVWKKEVSHVIDMKVLEDTVRHHLRDIRSPDTGLFDMMTTAAMAGKLTVYSNLNHRIGAKMTVKELDAGLIPPPDTMVVVDPVTGQEVRRIVHHDIDYDAITKYRILEEWAFNPTTGKTDIQIVAVAPVKEIVVDGALRGTRNLFWVKYADIRNLIDRYE